MNWRIGLLIVLILTSFLITSCGPVNISDVIGEIDSEDNTDIIPKEGGQVTIPLTNFNTLNPLFTTNTNYYHFSKLIFEGLFDFDIDLSIKPKLVESYFIFNEGKTLSLELKDGIRWHDGNPLTTDDVAFTIDVIKYANRDSIYGNVWEENLGVDGIDFNGVIETNVIDDKIIEIVFDNVYSNNLEVLTFPIIPRHIFQENSSNRNTIMNALMMEDYIPIGTGPYKFESYEKQRYINLIKNEDYWDGIPYIDEITGKILEDEELILTAFETGQVSFASTIGVDWDKYKQSERIKVLEYISPNYDFLGFNFDNDIMLGEKGLAIRKAIYYGINRQDLIHKVYLGHGTQIDVPLHPDSYLLSSYAYTYGYNIDMAINILSDAGFKDLDGDDILEDENGTSLVLRFITNPDNYERRLVGEMIKDYLYDIGIDLILDYDSQYKKEYTKEEEDIIWEEFNDRLIRGDFDMVLLGWQSSVITNFSPMFHSSMIDIGTNFINYKNEMMDQLLVDTLIDRSREEKIDLYEKFQKHIVEDIPYMSLYFENKGLLVDTRIQGDLNPTFFNLYNGIENCYIVE